MVYDTANRLAAEIRQSEEYRACAEMRARAMENSTTRALIEEYHKLQIRAQAAAISGERDGQAMERLQKVGELLQFDADASAFLMAEYRLQRMLGDIYKTLADAADVDLSSLES